MEATLKSFPCVLPMSDSSAQQQFGLIVAYLLPGFIGLAGVVPLVPAVGQWLQPVAQGDLGFGPPIYALLSAITVGMIVSCFRWLLVDHILELTGMPKAVQGYEKLPEKLDAYDYLIDVHYRYYQFYANMVVAIIWAYLLNRYMKTLPLLGFGTDLGALILCTGLLAGARDSLAKYRKKLGRVFGSVAEKDAWGDSMTNGADHHGSGAAKPHPESKPEGKTVAPVKPDDAKSKGGAASK